MILFTLIRLEIEMDININLLLRFLRGYRRIKFAKIHPKPTQSEPEVRVELVDR